jgi:hypothetical protein
VPGEGEPKGVGAISPRAPDREHRDRFRPEPSRFAGPPLTGLRKGRPNNPDIVNDLLTQDTS